MRAVVRRRPLTPEVIARLIRITSGTLRLLTRLLTQIERVLSVNDAQLFLSKSSKPLATASSSVRPDCRGYDKQFLKLYDR